MISALFIIASSICIGAAGMLISAPDVLTQARIYADILKHRPGNMRMSSQALLSAPVLKELAKKDRAEKMRADCLFELPQMLDVVTLGLGSGLSFDGSLDLYCTRSKSALSSELNRAMTRWRLGLVTREEALDGVGSELHIQALKRFAHVVGESLTFGAPLAQTLEHQSDLLRAEQRSQLEEDLEKLPVKMLIPLGTLILPAMLIAILGPLLGSSFAFI